ncbi:rhodanese-like domain-containing protein [Methylohalobius crimeensis]|uniref:rhodanese-like domain-containing protein n=1 Tax=Methylohalobius crimeensis TaxID=244365 RepID=UPI0003B3EC5F|nr:rhodanese-like domain-containing protein [Methylohalobius crimeensis]
MDQQRDIDVNALASMRRNGRPHLVLDIREPQEVGICGLEDSLNIPMHEVPHHLASILRDRPVVVLCHHGIRSAMVTSFLQNQGFDNVWNLAGGIDAWARFIDETMPRY